MNLFQSTSFPILTLCQKDFFIFWGPHFNGFWNEPPQEIFHPKPFLVGRIGPNLNLNALYAFCMLICGMSTALVPFLTDLTSLGILAGLFGFFISGN